MQSKSVKEGLTVSGVDRTDVAIGAISLDESLQTSAFTSHIIKTLEQLLLHPLKPHAG